MSKHKESAIKREWCCRCGEDFPLGEQAQPVRMGLLYPITHFPDEIRRKVRNQIYPSRYLCGNCYFDILDELDDLEGV